MFRGGGCAPAVPQAQVHPETTGYDRLKSVSMASLARGTLGAVAPAMAPTASAVANACHARGLARDSTAFAPPEATGDEDCESRVWIG